MFGNLLKEKRTIEEKIRKLQNKYIALRHQSIIGNNQSEEEKNIVKDNLAQKQAILNKIKQEHRQFLRIITVQSFK